MEFTQARNHRQVCGVNHILRDLTEHARCEIAGPCKSGTRLKRGVSQLREANSILPEGILTSSFHIVETCTEFAGLQNITEAGHSFRTQAAVFQIYEHAILDRILLELDDLLTVRIDKVAAVRALDHINIRSLAEGITNVLCAHRLKTFDGQICSTHIVCKHVRCLASFTSTLLGEDTK